jgi:chemotaxis protein methyltransferase CheR
MIRAAELIDIEIKLLLEGIYLQYKSDFRNYTLSSLRRRLILALDSFGCRTISQLQDRILWDASLYDKLLQYLTVPTSEMFRDPNYYRQIREQVLPVLSTYPSVKIWIAGCSTGEELYSFAILLKEEGLLERAIIYATDISPHSLKLAELGTYPLAQIKTYEASYLASGAKGKFADYYDVDQDAVIFKPELKANVLFADHSLANDSVFAEVQLISCRNVLIYFNRQLQTRAFRLFHDSLAYRGFLGLGSKETMRYSEMNIYFEEFLPRERIYRKKGQ